MQTAAINLRGIIYWAALGAIFAGALGIPNGPSFLNGNVILSLTAFILLSSTNSFKVQGGFICLSLILLLHGLCTIVLGKNSAGEFFSVYITTVLFFVLYQNLLKNFEGLIYSLKIYFRLAEFISWLLIFQFIMYHVGPRFLFDFGWALENWVLVPGGPFGLRASGVLYEPSQLGLTCALAQVVAIARCFGLIGKTVSLRFCVAILLAAILSGSTLVLANLSISGFVLIFHRLSRLWIIICLGLVTIRFIDFQAWGVISDRLLGVFELFVLSDANNTANASSYTLYVHTNVAFENFKSTMGFGSGMGSHILAYERLDDFSWNDHNVLSISTAANLFNRLISELGILGIGILVWLSALFVKTFFNFKNDFMILYCLLAVIPFLLRNGTYSYFGLAFYVALVFSFMKLRIRFNPLNHIKI